MAETSRSGREQLGNPPPALRCCTAQEGLSLVEEAIFPHHGPQWEETAACLRVRGCEGMPVRGNGSLVGGWVGGWVGWLVGWLVGTCFPEAVGKMSK